MSATSLSAFEVIATPSHADLLEEGVQTRLLDSVALAEVVGDRIFLAVDPMARPSEPMPLLTVFTPSEARDQQLQGESQVTLPVGIGIWYDEVRNYREPGDRSVKSLVNLILSILMADQRLDQDPLGPACLAESISRTETLDYGAFNELDDDGELICSGLYRQIILDYQYTVDAITGVIA